MDAITRTESSNWQKASARELVRQFRIQDELAAQQTLSFGELVKEDLDADELEIVIVTYETAAQTMKDIREAAIKKSAHIKQ